MSNSVKLLRLTVCSKRNLGVDPCSTLEFIVSRFDRFFSGNQTFAISSVYWNFQFACLVFGGEKPIKVSSTGHLNSHGTDESASFTFLYKDGKTATMATQTKVVFLSIKKSARMKRQLFVGQIQ